MSSAIEYKNRVLIPRLLTHRSAGELGELHSVNNRMTFPYDPNLLERRESEWHKNKSIIFAIELVNSAVFSNDYSSDTSTSAAEYILKNRSKTSTYAVSIAKEYLGIIEENKFEGLHKSSRDITRIKIAQLKGVTSSYPKNPIPFVDLSFYYASLGQNKKSINCMRIAISLSPDNRFIIRSAVRLFIHYGFDDRALDIVRSSKSSKQDPWLISTEISLSESMGTKSTHKNIAKRLIKQGISPNIHYSELCAIMSSLEMSHGAIKKGKKLMQNALVYPAENTIAQANWLENTLGIDLVPTDLHSYSHEGQTRKFYQQKKYRESLDASKHWHDFQPFSPMAAINGSYLASIALRAYDEAEELCKAGMYSSQKDLMLVNNLIFSQIQQGKLVDAKTNLEKIHIDSLEDRYKYTFIATQGLLCYRENNIEKGRQLYLTALEGLKVEKAKKSVSLLLNFWAEEEQDIDSEFAKRSKSESVRLAKEENLHELLYRVEN